MADNKLPSNATNSNEIDLGQLFTIIKTGFNNLFMCFLGVYSYIRKHIFILIGLIIVGLAIGYGLNQIITKKTKTEVIVKPNLESKNYLYDVVNEIQANIEAEDTLFFNKLDIDVKTMAKFDVMIEPVTVKAKNLDDEMKYLELLQNFENTGIIADIVREEVLDKSSLNHRITFFYKQKEIGQANAKKLIAYINSNAYYTSLVEVYRDNAKKRLEENEALLEQVDEIIKNYSQRMAKDNAVSSSNETVVLDNQERVNITGLFELKNELIRDIESKNIELKKNTEPIKIINFGNPQEVQKSFFGKNLVLIPLILVSLFFLFAGIKYLNKLSDESRS